MIRSLILGVAVCAVACLLVACVDLDSPSGASIRVQHKEMVWIAFLDAHCVPDKHVEFSGNMLKITLTQTEGEKSKIATARDVLGRSDADGIVMSSGDPDLIKLHEKMKAAENAIGSSPEYGRVLQASTQLSLVQRAYSAGPLTNTGDTPLDVLRNGGSVADLAAAHAREDAAAEVRDNNEARLELAKQSSSVANKAKSEGQKAQAALDKVRQHYAIPTSDLITVMQHYLPSGTKGWSSEPLFGLHFDALQLASMPPIAAQTVSNGIYLRYGTWTY